MHRIICVRRLSLRESRQDGGPVRFYRKFNDCRLYGKARVKPMLDRISLILVIIGALNGGAIGLFKFDIVSGICGGQEAMLARIIYTVVALAGLWCISLLFKERESARY